MKNIVIDGVEYTPIIKNDEIEIITIKQEEISLQVYPTDLGKMNWETAMKACANLNDGWRLPTKEELTLLYNNSGILGGFANINYWSSTEYDNVHAWFQDFGTGFQFSFNKYYTFYVRAVRDYKIK